MDRLAAGMADGEFVEALAHLRVVIVNFFKCAPSVLGVILLIAAFSVAFTSPMRPRSTRVRRPRFSPRLSTWITVASCG